MMLYKISRVLLLLLFQFFFRLEVKGKSNVPKTGGFILASNHVSYLDPLVLGVACPRPLNFLARHDLFKIPLFGAFIHAVGAFPLRRNFADVASIKEALRRLREASGLVLFPEGSRSFQGFDRNAQPGIGFIASKSQVPVVPAFIKGTQRALGRHARLIRPTKIRVYFGKRLYPVRPMCSAGRIRDRSNEVYTENSNRKDSYGYFADKVMHEIRRLSNGNKGGQEND